MNKTFKIISLLALVSFSAIACKGPEEENNNSSQEGEVIKDKFLVKGGLSDYYVVLPEKSGDKVVYAAREFVDYIYASSDYTLPIITDKDVKKDYKFISFGNTTQFEAKFSDVDFSPLENTQSAYFISTEDDNIYIASNKNSRGNGVLCGTYDLLHMMIDYTYYAKDEIHYDNKEDINLVKYDRAFVNYSFDSRSIGTRELTFNDENNTRLGLINIYRGQEWAQNLYGHSQVRAFLSPEDKDANGVPYGTSHPEWFLHVGVPYLLNQLCWSSFLTSPEFVDAIAKKFIYYFQEYPDAIYFMFGQEDNKTPCQCDRCVKEIEEHAGSYAGLQIELMNRIIEKTDAWLNENQPGREVKYVVFAYYFSKEPPVKSDGKGGYKPYSDSVIPNKNILFFYAAIEANYLYPLESPVNVETNSALNKWSYIASGQIMIYFYDVNFHNYFINFCNFGVVKSMYKVCHDYGVSYMYSQGAMDTATSCFSEMRAYVESNLMKDLSKDYEVLAKDFMDNYYKDASSAMQEIYQINKDRYAYWIAAEPGIGSIYGNVATSRMWPSSVVRKLDQAITNAMEAIEKYQSSNSGLYTLLKNRIMKEYLAIIYLKVTLYRATYTDEQIEEMKNIFEYYTNYYSIVASMEGGNLGGIF